MTDPDRPEDHPGPNHAAGAPDAAAPTEAEMAQLLAAALAEFAAEHGGPPLTTRTFAEAGLAQHGLLLRVGDQEFELTLVRRRG